MGVTIRKKHYGIDLSNYTRKRPPHQYKFLDLTGQTFNRLTCLYPYVRKDRHTLPPHNRRVYWLCKCQCGKHTIVMTNNLTNKSSQSCGCLSIESRRDPAHREQRAISISITKQRKKLPPAYMALITPESEQREVEQAKERHKTWKRIKARREKRKSSYKLHLAIASRLEEQLRIIIVLIASYHAFIEQSAAPIKEKWRERSEALEQERKQRTLIDSMKKERDVRDDYDYFENRFTRDHTAQLNRVFG